MHPKRKTTLIISICLAVILLIQVFVSAYYPNLTFINGTLVSSYNILRYIVFSGFILTIPLLFNATKILKVPVGIVLFLMLFINSCTEIFPIDTKTKPKDVSILQTNDDGSKWIVRTSKNVKTSATIQDTELVRDKFIFRTILERKE